MSIKVFRDENASAVFVAQGTVGAWPYNCLRAIGGGDGTLSIQNLSKAYIDGKDFFEVVGADYDEFTNEAGVAWGATEVETVNSLNAIFLAAGTPSPSAPVITSALTIALTEGNVVNYELTATDGVGFEWDSLPEGITTVEGNVRKIIGGSSLAAGTYNIGAQAINYYGVHNVTIVLTVTAAAVPFQDTYSTNFVNADYLTATASTSHPMYRAGNGSGATDAWTLSFWFKAGSTYYSSTSQTILCYGGDSPSYEAQVLVSFAGSFFDKRIVLRYGSALSHIQLETANNSSTSGTWEHWVITYDGGTTGASFVDTADYYGRFAIYKNGVAMTTTNTNSLYGTTTSVPNDVFYIGRQGGSTNYLRNNARLNEVAIWNSDETANVADIYNSGSTHDLADLTTPPTIWYRMGDGDTYPTLQDDIGSVDMTMMNMTAADIVSDVP